MTEFPTAPECGTSLNLRDDDYTSIALQDGKRFPFYGVDYDAIFVGSNGYITFGGGDSTYVVDFESHFALPRVAPYMSDMFPPGGGLVLVTQLDDRMVVTFDKVPDFFGDIQSFQAELFFDGAIRLTWLDLTFPFGIVGVSEGNGIPPDFEESDFAFYPQCEGDSRGPGDCGDREIVRPMQCSAASIGGGGPGNRTDSIVMLLAVGSLFMARRRARVSASEPRFSPFSD